MISAVIYVDGGSTNNGSTDQQGYGSFRVFVDGKPVEATFKADDGTPYRLLHPGFKFGNVTNNFAELSMLIIALAYTMDVQARSPKAQLKWIIRSDSTLAVNAFNKGVKKASKKLMPLYNKLKEYGQMLHDRQINVTVQWIDNNSMKEVLGH